MQTTNTNKHELTILEAFPEDEGQYKCLVTNPAGSTSSSAFLKIIRKSILNNSKKFYFLIILETISLFLTENANSPSFIKTIVDSQTDENLPAEFSVQVKGDPTPKVEWSHNGTVVKEGVNHLVILVFN